MRIVVAADEGTLNPYVDHLAGGLRGLGHEVACGPARFFEPREGIDVVHVHWPEALGGWSRPTGGLARRVADAAEAWRRARARLVVTRHNELPHEHRDGHARALYGAVLDRADGIVHLGQESRRADPPDGPPSVVIPHGLYPHADALPRARARADLGVGEDAAVVLCYGALRTVDEQRLVATARAALGDRAVWFVPRWGGVTRPSWWGRPLRRLEAERRDRWGRRVLRHEGGVVSGELERSLFSAADVVLVPRARALNSGVLVLAYSYGRAVVGPGVGNLREILEATGNPIYDPGDPASVARCLSSALEADPDALGEANRRYALANWGWADVAERHDAFMATLVRAGA